MSLAASAARFWKTHRRKLVASAVITALMLYGLEKGGLTLLPSGVSFGALKPAVVPAYFASVAFFSYFRCMRWRYLLRGVGHVPPRRLLVVSLIGNAAILLFPFRLGEMVRPYMVRRKGEISLRAATGTIVAERVVDGFYLSVILAAALFLVPTVDPLPERVIGLPVSVAQVRAAGFLMLGVFTAALITIAVFYFARELAQRLTRSVFGVVSTRLADKLSETAGHLASGLHFFSRPRDLFGFLFESSVYWLVNAAGMWMLAWGAGVVHADGSAPTFGEACALMGMLGVSILIPGPPGLLGTFQGGLYAGMTMYYPRDVVTGAGAAYVFLVYGLQLLWTVGAAAVCLFVDRGAVKDLEEAERLIDGDEPLGDALAEAPSHPPPG